MLKTMRDNIKSLSWTLWMVIIAFIGFVFVEWGTGRMDLAGSDTDVARVGGTALSAVEFQNDLLKTLENYKSQFKNNFNKSIINQLRIPEQILQRSINSIIIKKEAGKLALDVSNDELKENILDFYQVYNDKEKGPTRVYLFRENYRPEGKFIGLTEYERRIPYLLRMSVPEFEKNLKEGIVIDKFKELVTGGLVIDRERLKEMYKKENDQADLEYISLKTDRVEETVKPEKDELREYYNRNKEDFKSAERRLGRVVAYKYDDFKKEISVPDEELFDYFKKNKRMFVTPGKTRVSRIFLPYDQDNRDEVLRKAEDLHQTLTTENFSETAKNQSQDEKAKAGGNWGYWEWRNLSSPELSSIERLEENGISTVINTSEGFSILHVPEKVPEQQQTFDKVKERIKNIIEREKLNTHVEEKLGKVYERLKGEENIKSKAKEMEIKVIDTGELTNGQPIKDLADMGYISRRLFTMEEKEVVFPVKFTKGVAIVQLAAIKEPVIEPFEKAEKRVRDAFVLSKKMEMLTMEAENISKQLNNLGDEEKQKDYLEKNNLIARTHIYKRGNKLAHLPVQQGLDDLIFSLEENRYTGPIKFEKEIVLAKLNSKNIMADTDFENSRAAFYNTKIENLKNNFFAAFILKKRESYDVKFNVELYTKIKDYVMAKYK